MSLSPNNAGSTKDGQNGHSMMTPLRKESKLTPKNIVNKFGNKKVDDNKGITSPNPTNKRTNLHSNVKSKIPTKSSTLLVPTGAAGKANTARPSSHSLKISNENESLALQDTGKVLKNNTSKASFSSNNCGKVTPRSHIARTQFPTGIRRRSGKLIFEFKSLYCTCLAKRVYDFTASTMSSCSSHPFSKENSDITFSPITSPKSNPGDHDNCALTPRERVNENNKLKAFESIEKRLTEIQSEFWQKLESLKFTPADKLKGTYKFITVMRNDKHELLVNGDDMKKAPKALPAYSINQFKERLRTTLDKCVLSLFDYYKDYHTLDEEDNGEISEKLQNTVLNELNVYLDDLCDPSQEQASSNTDVQIVKMQRELQECNKSLKMADKKLSDAQTAYDDKVHDLEIEFKTKCDEDIATRDIQISELQKKVKFLDKQNENLKADKELLEDDTKNNKTNVSNMTEKISQLEMQLEDAKQDLLEKTEKNVSLTKDLDEVNSKLEDVAMQKQNTAQVLEEQKIVIENLKNTVDHLVVENKTLQDQLESLEKENATDHHMQMRLEEADNRIAELQSNLEAIEKLKENQNQSKEAQMEMAKLRQSEAEKRREIEKLKIELSKAQYNMVQLEEQVQRDQQLLDVRSKLINSLQTNEKDQRIHMEELYAQIGEKNNLINELNNELRVKSEEFRNLFTTISAKQMELSNQEHMIKLLEESNDRSQMLRVKQEEKIGRMEEEIAHLKQTMAVYQTNVLSSNNTCKSLLFEAVTSTDNYNENFYYYTSERRRKRQTDISVKKYEI
uniref:Uncharacterized protein n=1 Tax=Glossina brevipalpis TaxID=37001 RepID=A0A1A9WV28_9MUSC